MATVTLEFKSNPSIRIEYDVDAEQDITEVRAYNEAPQPACLRFTETSLNRSTGWVLLPPNTQAEGTPVLTRAIPKGVAGRMRLLLDSRGRFHNLNTEFMYPCPVVPGVAFAPRRPLAHREAA